MARYFTRPRAWIGTDFGQDWDATNYSAPMVPALSVADHEATDTGLLDQNGDCIMRAPNPMGFHWGDER